MDSLIALAPEARRSVYGREPKAFDRTLVSEHWKQWFAKHLSSSRYLQRLSKLLEVVDAETLEEKFRAEGTRLRDLAIAFYRGRRPGWEEIVNDVD